MPISTKGQIQRPIIDHALKNGFYNIVDRTVRLKGSGK
jgi:hypothetical protein